MTHTAEPEADECPLCMEELDMVEKHFKPCSCGYQICRFCWHHIKSNLNGRCPACRRLYCEQHVRFTPISAEMIKELEKDKRVKVRMAREPSKQQLLALRVIQKNVVHVINMSLKHADKNSEILSKLGKIEKLVIGKPPSAAAGFYLTFATEAEANRAREELNGMKLEGEIVRTFFGTTKYCTHFINKTKCPINGCLFLHEFVPDKPKPIPTGKEALVPSYAIKISDVLKATGFSRTAMATSQTWPSLPLSSSQEFKESSASQENEASVRNEGSPSRTVKSALNKKQQKKRMKPFAIEDPHPLTPVAWSKAEIVTIKSMSASSGTAASLGTNDSITESKLLAKGKKKGPKAKTARVEEARGEEKKERNPEEPKENRRERTRTEDSKEKRGERTRTEDPKEESITQNCTEKLEEKSRKRGCEKPKDDGQEQIVEEPKESRERVEETEEDRGERAFFEELKRDRQARIEESKEGRIWVRPDLSVLTAERTQAEENQDRVSHQTLFEKEEWPPEELCSEERLNQAGNDSLGCFKSIMKVCDPQMPVQKLWTDPETHAFPQPEMPGPVKNTFRLSSDLLNLRQRSEEQHARWLADRNFDPFGEQQRLSRASDVFHGFQNNTGGRRDQDYFQSSSRAPIQQGLYEGYSFGANESSERSMFVCPGDRYFNQHKSCFIGPYLTQIEASVRQRSGIHAGYEDYGSHSGVYLTRDWCPTIERTRHGSDYRMTNNQMIPKEFYPHPMYERMIDPDSRFQTKAPYGHERRHWVVNGAWFPPDPIMFQPPFVPYPHSSMPRGFYQEDYPDINSMHLG